MSRVKTPFDGLGSGAGVAWSAFNLLAATMGLALGSPFVIALAAVSALAFMVITLSMFYISYQTIQENDKKLAANDNLQAAQLKTNLNRYLNILKSNQTQDKQASVQKDTTDLHDKFKEENNSIQNELDEAASAKLDDKLRKYDQASCVLLLSFSNFKPTSNESDVELIFNDLDLEMFKLIPEIPVKTWFNPAYGSFVGAFGSIAGGTGGFTGVLFFLGVFSGFQTIPIVGWSVFAAAIIVGILVATRVAEKAEEDYYLKQHNDLKKNMNYVLKEIIESKKQKFIEKGFDYSDANTEHDWSKTPSNYSTSSPTNSNPRFFGKQTITTSTFIATTAQESGNEKKLN